MRAILYDAAAGLFRIVVSALTIVEVSRKPKHPIDPALKDTIVSFFARSEIYVHDLDALVAERALDLVYEFQWLHPKDSVMLATAIHANCSVFYTTDKDLIRRFNGQHGLTVATPGTPVGYGQPVNEDEFPLLRLGGGREPASPPAATTVEEGEGQESDFEDDVDGDDDDFEGINL